METGTAQIGTFIDTIGGIYSLCRGISVGTFIYLTFNSYYL